MADIGYRPMGLETDVANPNFSGATNPDSFLHAEFYWHEPWDRNKTEEASEKAGKFVRVKSEKQVYIRIMKPGDQTSILETPVREDHKRRFPEKWLYFQMSEGLIEDTKNQSGWKVEGWEELTPDEIHKLKYHRFYTVEQIANASDSQIQGYGMGGLAMRKKAQDALAAKQAAAKVVENSEIEELKKTVAELKAMLQPKAQQVAEPASNETPPSPTLVSPAAPTKGKYVMTAEHKAKLKAAREAKKK